MRVTSNGVLSTVERPAVRTTRSKPLASVACAAAAPPCAAIGDTMRHTSAVLEGPTRNGTRNTNKRNSFH